ncbi:hypothetical protein CBM2609_B120037 [Cupriavidus taiwanensis]|nr:hypothetical protein CBM2604_B130037 [Cupriavidus taiwanensis]SOZ31078.1 hypothetical protein CBM2609_B120037 [Cupriavidus taiwanensis]SOZ47155.1 hypothetical protein CBM2610_B100037 [Cupriavidus taiwanensis]
MRKIAQDVAARGQPSAGQPWGCRGYGSGVQGARPRWCGRCRAWRAASHYGCGAGESGRGMVVMVLALNGCADPAIVAVA